MSGEKEKNNHSSGQRRAQNFLLVWVDTNIDETKPDFQNSLTQLRSVVNDVNIFTRPDRCIQFLKSIQQEKAFLIASGSLGQHLIPDITFEQWPTDRYSIRNSIVSNPDLVRIRSESRGSSTGSRSSSRASSIMERMTSSFQSLLCNSSISSSTAVDDPMQIAIKSYIKDAKKLCKKIENESNTINEHQEMKVKRYFERLMKTVKGFEVTRPPSSNNNIPSYSKTFHKILDVLKRMIAVARSVSARAMIIWSVTSLVEYTDALAAVDAILSLIIDSPRIIYDKGIAWETLRQVIYALFECFPSILDSNVNNIMIIKQNGFRSIVTFKVGIGPIETIQSESIKLQNFFQ